MTKIHNPILRGFNPDPSILRVGEDYYIATSTFERFPGVQIHHSRDLVNWRLLIYALAERKLRQALQEMKLSIPNQTRKPTQRPTMRWVFLLFEGLDILLVKQNDETVLRQLLNLRPAQEQVIKLLGAQVKNCYLFGS